MNERIILVNEQDCEIGQQEKITVHKLGLLHRAFSVFVFRINQAGNMELLLQQRHLNKYHCGGLWSNTCCGHPRSGEEIVEAAERRLCEEMGLVIKLIEIGVFNYKAEFTNGLTENEVDHILIGNYHDELIQANAQEVSNYCWQELQSVWQDLHVHEEKYTPWFATALRLAERGLEAIKLHTRNN
jgi:isopentenyl-diphosphate delta-isomerase type 1